jgi:hypothetical protein
MDEAKYQRMVVFVGRWRYSSTQGFDLPPYSPRGRFGLRENAWIFRNKQSPSCVILDKIKVEDHFWVIAGTKKLGSTLLGE